MGSEGYSLGVVLGLLIAVASLAVEHELWALVAASCRLRSYGSWAVEHRLSSCGYCLSYPVAYGIFLDQESNLCPLHWQEDS